MQAEAGRRLAAIMFTDIVGYTALTERDEAKAIEVRDRHRGIVRPLVGQFEGELIDATGDESLATFPSALLAVDCALAIQAALRDDADLRVRIGIHLGDVVMRDHEVIGEGVNVAARIRPLAAPGGICVSDQVYQVIRHRPHVATRSLGPQSFKNVGEPVEVYAVGSAVEEVGEPAHFGWTRAAKVVGGLVVTTAIFYAAYLPNRTAILSSIIMTAPKIFSDPIDQKIGFATTSDGVRIAYATTGEGPALIFVLAWASHLEKGIASPLYSPENWIRENSENHLFVRYDGRGFGLSDRNVDDFSIDARVADLAAVIDATGQERVSIYAVSGGGPGAVAYTARNPDRVSRLVLAGTTPGLANREPTPELLRTQETWRGMGQLFRTSWDDPKVRSMMVSFLNPDADELQQRVMSEFLAIAGDGHAVAGFTGAMMFDIDVRDEARRIQTPTLVIHGTEDATIPIEEGRILAALIPGARFEILIGKNHVQGTILEPEHRYVIADFLAEGEEPTVARDSSAP